MAELNPNDGSDIEHDLFYTEQQSPTRSSPELHIKRQKTRHSILPFSDQPTSSYYALSNYDNERPETAVETDPHDSDHNNTPKPLKRSKQTEDSDRPIRQSAQKTEELQLRYFQLQVELKEVRDQLGPLVYSDNTDKSFDTQGATFDTALNLKLINQFKLQNEQLKSKIQTMLQTRSEQNTNTNNDEHHALELLEQNVSQKQLIDELKQSLNTTQESLSESNTLSATYQGDMEFWKRKASDLQTSCGSQSEEIERLYQETQKLNAELFDVRNENSKLQINASTTPLSKFVLNSSNLDSPFEVHAESHGFSTNDLLAKLKHLTKDKTQISKMLDEQLQVNDRHNKMLDDTEIYIRELRRDLHNRNLETKNLKLDIYNLQKAFKDNRILKEKLEKNLSESATLNDSLKHQRMLLEQSNESKDEIITKERDSKKQLEVRISQLLNEEKTLTDKLGNYEKIQRQLRERHNCQKLSIADFKNQLADLDKQKQILSNLIVTGEKDHESIQNELNKTRKMLEKKENTIYELHHESSEREVELNTLKSKLEQESQKCSVQERDIDRLNTQVETLLAKIADTEERNKAMLKDVKVMNSTKLNDMRKVTDAEVERLKSAHIASETALQETINEMESQNYTLRDQYKNSDSKLQSLSLQIRNLKARVQELENEIADKQIKVDEYQRATRKAQSEALDLRSKFDTADQRESDARNKLTKLEKVNASLSLQLHELSSVDINALKIQADETSQLRQRVQEYTKQFSEWTITYNEMNMEIQRLQNANQELQEQIHIAKSTETEREEQTRLSIRLSYQNQIDSQQQLYQEQMDSQRQKFEYSYNNIKDSLAETQNERDLLKSQYATNRKELSLLTSQLEDANVELENLRKLNERLHLSSQELKGKLEPLTLSKTQMTSQISELELKLDKSRIEMIKFDNQMQSMKSQLNGCQQNLAEQIRELSNERYSWQQKEKAYEHYAQMLFNIRFSDFHQIRSLVFIKSFYGKCFPRLDIKKEIGQNNGAKKMRTLKEAILVVIAVIKFRAAGKNGLKRHAEESSHNLMI